MRAIIRQMRRAPVRIATSVLAIALAIAAIGVFAVPGVAESSLRSISAEDRLGHIHIDTTEIGQDTIDELLGLDNVSAAEGRTTATLNLADGEQVRVIGAPSDSTIDTLRTTSGARPDAENEVLVPTGTAAIGDTLTLAATSLDTAGLTVVGTGQTTYWADSEAVAFVTVETAQQVTGTNGFNSLVLRLDEPTRDNLDTVVGETRAVLDESGATFTSFPSVLVDGAHPIEEDLTQISFMIGSLGVVAGIVALILLASTANAIVTERTRDAAIMRALGGTRREVRRDLRRLAVTIGAIGTVVGIPLGIAVANIVASMVLGRFAGIDPAIGFDPVVLVASAAFGIIGARVVSGRVARRVAKQDVATALRDRDATPFGTRMTDRLLTRLPVGGLTHRIATRAIARRRGRAVAVAAQFAGAVAAAVLVASLATSITNFNSAELASFNWETTTSPSDPISPYRLDAQLEDGVEVATHTWAETDGWDIEVFGVAPDTTMIDRAVTDGTWLPPSAELTTDVAPLVLAERFGTQEGYAIGDMLTIDLASGPAAYQIVGYHPIKSLAAFVERNTLAADLGSPGFGNTIWTVGDGDIPQAAGVTATTTPRDALFEDDAAARDAILAIFAAIGVIVVAIAALGASSTVAMNLYERRSEVATLQATGAQRRDVRRLVAWELGALAAVGWFVGIGAGWLGASAIMSFFATANAIDLGFTLSWIAIPLSAVGAALLVWTLSALAARQAQRRPLAVALRATT